MKQQQQQLKKGGLTPLWQRLQLLPNFKHLQLLQDNLRAADTTPVSTLQHLQHLDQELGYGSVTVHPRELVSALQPLTQLRHLQLTRCQLHAVQPQPQQPQQQPQQQQQQQQPDQAHENHRDRFSYHPTDRMPSLSGRESPKLGWFSVLGAGNQPVLACGA